VLCVREAGRPFRKRDVPEGRVPSPYVSLQKRRINVLLSKAIHKRPFFSFLLMNNGAVKSLFFGGHCVLVARLSFVVEKCRYAVYFRIWANTLFVLLLVRQNYCVHD